MEPTPDQLVTDTPDEVTTPEKENGFAPYNGDEEAHSRTWLKWVLPLAVLAIIGLIGGWYLLSERTTTVETCTVQSSRIERTVSGSGQIKPYRPRDVYVASEGIIATLPVKDGQLVTKGDVLLTLETDAFETQLAAAEAALSQAQSARAQAADGVASQNALIAAANEGVNAAYAGVDLAYNTRAQADVDAEYAAKYLAWITAQPSADPAEVAASKQALETARMMQRESEAAIVAAEGQLAASQVGLAQAQAGNPQSAIGATDAAITAASRQVELAQKALKKATVKAPVAGRLLIAPTASAAAAQSMGAGSPLSGESLQVGAAVSPGMPIFTIADRSETRFVVEIDEAEIAQVKLDQKALVTLDGYPGEPLAGKVVAIASASGRNATGGTVFSVDIVLDKNIEDICYGIKGDVDIIVEATENTTVVPQQAVFSEDGSDFVYVIDAGTLVKTEVTLGQSAGELFEIKQGVAVGTLLARAGDVILADGMRVTTVER